MDRDLRAYSGDGFRATEDAVQGVLNHTPLSISAVTLINDVHIIKTSVRTLYMHFIRIVNGCNPEINGIYSTYPCVMKLTKAEQRVPVTDSH